MQPAIDVEQLRLLFLTASQESRAVRLLAVGLSVTLTAIVLRLVRRRALREEYTPIWLAVAGGLLALSLFPSLLRAVTQAIGAWTPSSALFFLGELFLVAICLNFAVRLSRTTLQVKNLGQELALLRARLDAREAASPSAPEP
jgi:hypothetical protein